MGADGSLERADGCAKALRLDDRLASCSLLSGAVGDDLEDGRSGKRILGARDLSADLDQVRGQRPRGPFGEDLGDFPIRQAQAVAGRAIDVG